MRIKPIAALAVPDIRECEIRTEENHRLNKLVRIPFPVYLPLDIAKRQEELDRRNLAGLMSDDPEYLALVDQSQADHTADIVRQAKAGLMILDDPTLTNDQKAEAIINGMFGGR